MTTKTILIIHPDVICVWNWLVFVTSEYIHKANITEIVRKAPKFIYGDISTSSLYNT